MLDHSVGAVQSRPQSLRYFCPANGATIPFAVQKDRGLWERDWVQCGHFDHVLNFGNDIEALAFGVFIQELRQGKHSLAFFGPYLSWTE